jgi:hypothetical protein
MTTEVVGTLTHADAPDRGNAPHSAPQPACVYHTLQYTYENILCGCYACGAITRGWANPRDTAFTGGYVGDLPKNMIYKYHSGFIPETEVSQIHPRFTKLVSYEEYCRRDK